jgi:ADP-ribose pyrophosphatase YjhB (NUDIX family)
MNTVPVCDHKSVGVLLPDEAGRRWLMFRRVRFPVGIAPAAGHVDGHGGFAAAARAEVGEELGLQVQVLRQVTGGWRPYPCRRLASQPLPGHRWAVYLAEATGQLRPDPAEAAGARWYTRAELQRLADRTVAHALGLITPVEFAADPGLEPVWLDWLRAAGLIEVEPTDLYAVDDLARKGDIYTTGGAR